MRVHVMVGVFLHLLGQCSSLLSQMCRHLASIYVCKQILHFHNFAAPYNGNSIDLP
jgi:hypothetical protein